VSEYWRVPSGSYTPNHVHRLLEGAKVGDLAANVRVKADQLDGRGACRPFHRPRRVIAG
jgi:phage gp29-like protein